MQDEQRAEARDEKVSALLHELTSTTAPGCMLSAIARVSENPCAPPVARSIALHSLSLLLPFSEAASLEFSGRLQNLLHTTLQHIHSPGKDISLKCCPGRAFL